MVLRTRSYRRFHQDIAIKSETLRELVNLARLSASAANRQPLKYVLSCKPEKNDLIFRHLSWAGYLKEWGGPEEGERPSGYIVVLGDRNISRSSGYDAGIAIQNMLLGATEKGLGGCIIGSIKREGLRNALDIPGRFEILLVLALGVPMEKVVIETTGDDGDIRYWRDGEGVHHVPKRRLGEIIIG